MTTGRPVTSSLLEVVDPGPLALVEDLGRPGVAEIGVPAGGAADRVSLRQANRLLGNPESAAGIECLLGGLALRPGSPMRLAVTGAPCEVTVDGRPVPFGSAIGVEAGAIVRLATPRVGLRTYVAVHGGIAGPMLHGSRASSPSLGLGPAPLRTGDLLHLGAPSPTPAAEAPLPGWDWRSPRALRVTPGPRTDWFTPWAVTTLTTTQWWATSALDRIGVRLGGPALTRRPERVGTELPSEPMVRGAIQVPPDGVPVVLLADHPTTGGYPVIGVVADADTDRIAQLRPGDPVRFRPAAPPW